MKSILITLKTSANETYCKKTGSQVVFRFGLIFSTRNYINSKTAPNVFKANDKPTFLSMSVIPNFNKDSKYFTLK